jgi:hypothetical protein
LVSPPVVVVALAFRARLLRGGADDVGIKENVRRERRERAKQREERERSRESGSDSERGICNHRTPPKAKSSSKEEITNFLHHRRNI